MNSVAVAKDISYVVVLNRKGRELARRQGRLPVPAFAYEALERLEEGVRYSEPSDPVTLPELMASIRAGLAAADNDKVRAAAHSLKSSSANLGANSLAELCKKLEMAARANALATDAPALPEVEAEYERVCVALQQEAGAAA